MTDLIATQKIAGWEKLKTLVLDSVSSPISGSDPSPRSAAEVASPPIQATPGKESQDEPRTFVLGEAPRAKDSASADSPDPKKRSDKAKAHPKAPKASLRDASMDWRRDRDAVRASFTVLTPYSTTSLQLGPPLIRSWAERLNSDRLLVASCIDPGVLEAVARTVPFHEVFAKADRLVVPRQDTPTLSQILDARGGGPAILVAYIVELAGVRWLRKLPIHDFDMTESQAPV
jgi:hypothetical protein